MISVSVVIPNYNHAKYLSQRIDSVLNQTLQDFEIILLDDHSTDDSLSVLNKYKHNPKVSHFIINETNSGSPFKQWLKGFELARGKYIWIAESDDYAELNFLEGVVPLLEENNQIGLVYVKSKLVAPDGSILKDYQYSTIGFSNEERWNSNYENNGKEEIKNYLSLRNIIPNASALVFRKCLLPQDISFIKKYKLIGDWYLWVRILEASNIFYLADGSNYFRMSENNSRSHRSDQKKILRIVEEIQLKKYLNSKRYLSTINYTLFIKSTFNNLGKILGRRKILSFVIQHRYLFSIKDYFFMLRFLFKP